MTPENIQPVREMLFIERDMEDDHFGDSPIIRPTSIQGEMCVATVLGVGQDVTGDYQPGDKIYLGALAGTKIVELNGPFFLIHEKEVLAKVVE